MSLARARKLTGDEPWLYIGERDCVYLGYGCELSLFPIAPWCLFANAHPSLASTTLPLFLPVILAGLVFSLITAPFGWAARARAIASFVVVVTPTRIVSTGERCAWCSCGETPGEVDSEVVVGLDVTRVELASDDECCCCCATNVVPVYVYNRGLDTGEFTVRRELEHPKVHLQYIKDAPALVEAIRNGPLQAPAPFGPAPSAGGVAPGATVRVASPLPAALKHGGAGAERAPPPAPPRRPPPPRLFARSAGAAALLPGYHGGAAKQAEVAVDVDTDPT